MRYPIVYHPRRKIATIGGENHLSVMACAMPPPLKGRHGSVQNKKAPLEGSCRRRRLRGVKTLSLFLLIAQASLYHADHYIIEACIMRCRNCFNLFQQASFHMQCSISPLLFSPCLFDLKFYAHSVFPHFHRCCSCVKPERFL